MLIHFRFTIFFCLVDLDNVDRSRAHPKFDTGERD